jgi:hypothetical protein
VISARLTALQPPSPPSPPGAGEPATATPSEAVAPTDGAVDGTQSDAPRASEFTIRVEDGGIVIGDPSGNTTPLSLDASDLIPPQVPEIIGLSFAGLIGIILAFPIGRAIARWIDRRGQVPAVDPQLASRLAAIEQAVDTVAIEVERMAEANRFTSRLLSERVAAPDFAASTRAADRAMSEARPPSSQP